MTETPTERQGHSKATIAGVLLLCAFALVVDGYDVQSLGLAVPALAEAFQVNSAALAPAMSASLLGMAIGAIALAPLGDRWGLRAVAVAVLVLMGISMLLTATSNGPTALTIWRFVTGLGIGAIAPIIVALAATYAPVRWRTLLVTLVIASMGLGSTIASFLAPAIEERFGWQGIFIVGGILPLIVAISFFFFAPKSKPEPALNPVVKPQSIKFTPLRLFESNLRTRTILLWLILFLNQSILYALISWLPALLELSGWDRAEAQRATGFLAAGGLIGGLVLAFAADRGKAALVLMAAYSVGAITVSLFLVSELSIWEWRILLVLTGFSAIGTMTTMGSLAAIYYPAKIRATGVGWASGVGRLGGVTGPLAMATLVQTGLSPTDLLPLLAVPLLLCAVFASGLWRVQLAND